jgi:hypothetical protein
MLFGGTGDDLAERNDTWEWDGSTWTERQVAGPPPARSQHAMAQDARRGEVVLFGGADGVGERGDTWVWDGTAWNEHEVADPPPARRGHALVYDGARGRVVSFGGIDAGQVFRNDTWEWDGAAWIRREIANPPKPRGFHAMAYDGVRAWTVIFGGNAGGIDLVDTWLFSYRAPSAPAELCLHGFDADGDGLIGCADPDCWSYCTPQCPPGASCDASSPRCGDGVCNPDLESCRLCPDDCGECAPVCGDFLCDAAETCAADCRAE